HTHTHTHIHAITDTIQTHNDTHTHTYTFNHKHRHIYTHTQHTYTRDPNTAHRDLRLSEGNRRVEWRDEVQSYPDHPERFDYYHQVLCREDVSGRCYWEIERSGELVMISVSYKSIIRRGGVECGFGWNDKSWSLALDSSCCYF